MYILSLVSIVCILYSFQVLCTQIIKTMMRLYAINTFNRYARTNRVDPKEQFDQGALFAIH